MLRVQVAHWALQLQPAKTSFGREAPAAAMARTWASVRALQRQMYTGLATPVPSQDGSGGGGLLFIANANDSQ